ncbi:MAG: type II toxin-antitoxin system PemK/MazF family toxin [Bacteroidota bacterium]
MNISQYQVAIVNLDPTIGSEIKKTRPCVVVSPDEMNRHLKTVVIAPVTSTSKPYPTRVKIILRGNENWVVLDQIRTIDKARITVTVQDRRKS